MLGGDDCQYPDNICTININKSLEDLGQGDNIDGIARAVRDPENMTDFGLQFLFEIQKDLVLSNDVIEVIYKTISKIASSKPHAL
jgi:hypothetical protein